MQQIIISKKCQRKKLPAIQLEENEEILDAENTVNMSFVNKNLDTASFTIVTDIICDIDET